MELPTNKVYEILQEKGVNRLYHANSVITACQFLRHGSLLSRGTVERKQLSQTSQLSDDIDRKHGVWFDLFMDSDDYHERIGKRNLYGPVLLVLDVELIKKVPGKVWVTKLNPTKWNGKPHEEKWFVSTSDLREDFRKGRFDQMIVFRNCGGEIPIRDSLKSVILDDPGMKTGDGVNIFSMAYGALKLSLTEGGMDRPIKKRECKSGCSCEKTYQERPRLTMKMFYPETFA